eukprot:scaffold1901_cov236-Pinguiococcus_pyrenoidosus.AAC.8
MRTKRYPIQRSLQAGFVCVLGHMLFLALVQHRELHLARFDTATQHDSPACGVPNSARCFAFLHVAKRGQATETRGSRDRWNQRRIRIFKRGFGARKLLCDGGYALNPRKECTAVR